MKFLKSVFKFFMQQISHNKHNNNNVSTKKFIKFKNKFHLSFKNENY